MKHSTLIILLGAMLAAGCSRQEATTTEKSTPTVYTVNYPLAYFAERIAGEFVDVVFPDMEGDPAFWNPSPEEIVEYQDADLILLNGGGYAKWVPKGTLPQAKLVDTSAAFGDRFIAMDEAANHTHGPGGAHVHGELAFTTWLDPQLAILQAAAIRDAFSSRWSEHAVEFEAGFQALESDLVALDAQLEKSLSEWGSSPLIGSHPVYQYLARRYTLNLQSVHWEPDVFPDAAMWRELVDLLETHPAGIMLWEGEPMDEAKTKLVEKGIQSIVFDPCGNRPAVGDYLSVMESNLHGLE